MNAQRPSLTASREKDNETGAQRYKIAKVTSVCGVDDGTSSTFRFEQKLVY